MRQRLFSAASAVLLAVAAVEGARGVCIFGKAELAQLLLQHAWLRARDGETCARPWPWADTWAVARLSFPDRGRQAVVLEGASGRILAFAPGHLNGSALPGAEGTCVLAGHRDTHFAVLGDLVVGETVQLEDPEGSVHVYRVADSAVVHQDDTWALSYGDGAALALVTCWPFDAVVSGGPMRYVVWAELVQVPNADSSRGRPVSCLRSRQDRHRASRAPVSGRAVGSS